MPQTVESLEELHLKNITNWNILLDSLETYSDTGSSFLFTFAWLKLDLLSK